METTTKVLIGLGVFAAAVTAVGVYEHFQTPTVTTPVTSGANVTTNVPLNATLNITTPAGASFPQATAANTGTPGATVKLNGNVVASIPMGATAIAVQWQDTTGVLTATVTANVS